MAIVVELATAPARSIHTKPRGPAWRPTRRLGVSENDWREIEEVSWWQTLFHIKNGGPTGLIGPDWFGLSKLNDAYCVTARFIFAEIKWCTSWTEIKWCYSAFKLYCDVIVMNSKQCAWLLATPTLICKRELLMTRSDVNMQQATTFQNDTLKDAAETGC